MNGLSNKIPAPVALDAAQLLLEVLPTCHAESILQESTDGLSFGFGHLFHLPGKIRRQ